MTGIANERDADDGRPSESEQPTETDTRRPPRRAFVKGAAIAGISTLGLSSTAAASGSYTKYDGEYRHVVNVVEAGADNTGNKSITPVLRNLRKDNTLFYFPPGRYAMDSQLRFTKFDNVAFVGNDATLVPANYYNFDGPQYRLFRLGTLSRPGKKLRFEGFTVDQTAKNTGIRTIDTVVTDRLDVEDIYVKGEHDSGTMGPARFDVIGSNGTGRVVDFKAPDGGENASNTPHAGKTSTRGPIGILANETAGELTFRRCHLGGFPGSGLYACNGSGKVIVHGGLYQNSTSASIRIGGSDSVVRWPTIEIDDVDEKYPSHRGIRVERGDVTIKGAAIRVSDPSPSNHAISVLSNCESAWIENTTIEMSGNDVNHGIVVSPGAGETTIARTNITHNAAGGYPLWLRSSNNTDRVHCEYLSIDGEAGDASGLRDGIRCERPNVRFAACEIDQPGRNGAKRNAIVNTSEDLSVWNMTLRASHFPIVELGSNSSYLEADAESYNGREAACLYDQSRKISIRNSRLVNGVRDLGSWSLELSNNTTY
ncbi:right-handed parallel beta-helix repeat-containing protein [Natronosalvus caseinilyticus]|uniref:right-handed parallel beta-helix repeat-containing protein n=1 Tax=Natronosalvus caseinilyticus TaxID=2953747 RepID=UPI0028A99940|nr:right-handed parallel beta-helix repeat-containing protein [Natronosalvus caseinilyticus]